MTRLRDLVEVGDLDALRDDLAKSAQAHELDEALRAAIRTGNVEAQRLIIGAGADVNYQRERDGWRPLHSTIEHRQTDTVRMLVSLGADPKLGGADGATPLHLAVDVEADEAHQSGEAPGTGLIELLLELGADPAIPDIDGNTARDWARDAGHVLAVKALDGR
jgi:ankyrin repeat protein